MTTRSVPSAIADIGALSNERITLSCCDAAPEFAVVASIAVFVDIETFDLSAGLQVYLHKKGYTVSESLGY